MNPQRNDRTIVHLLNGEPIPATVTWEDGWTRIRPDRGLPLDGDKIFVREIRGTLTAEEAARSLAASWLKKSEGMLA